MEEKAKKQNRGTKFTWFACLTFALALGFMLFYMMALLGAFDNGESSKIDAYATNAQSLAFLFLGFGVSIILFLVFRLCTCWVKKASNVYRINKISMFLLLISFLVEYVLGLVGILPMMLKNEQDIINGTGASNLRGHGFLALFTGYNDWLVWTALFSPILFLAIYVLMFVLMVKAAKEVRADIKAAKVAAEERKNEKRAALDAKKAEERKILLEKKEKERLALETQREEERKRLEEERARKKAERQVQEEQKKAERKAQEEQKKAEKEAKTREAAEKKVTSMVAKAQKAVGNKPMAAARQAEVVALEPSETSAQANDLEKEILEYLKRKEALRSSRFAFFIVSLPILVLQILCIPAFVEYRYSVDFWEKSESWYVEVGDYGTIPLLIAFAYLVINLVFILIGLVHSKKMTLSLRVLVFSSLCAQLLGSATNFLYSSQMLPNALPHLILIALILALLVTSIVLLLKYKRNEKIKNYISIGSIGFLIVLEGIMNIFPSYAFLFMHPNYPILSYHAQDTIIGIVILLVLAGLVFPLIFFSKKLAEGYASSKALPEVGKKPRAMTDEEKLETLQKNLKTATKEGDMEKIAALNGQILDLTEKIKNNPRGASTFDGRLIQLIGYHLLGALLTGVTFGIAYPWAKCFVERWSVKHLVVDGKRLSFDGKGVQLLGKFILWVLLTIITFGIFSFWFAIKMKKWTASHSHIEGSENPAESKSTFDGRLIQLIGYNLLSFLMTVFTLGIAYPWAKCLKENWGVKHTIIDGNRLEFDGKGIQLFGKYIVWLILTVVTFGIYGLWLSIKMKKWVASHTHFETMPMVEAGASQKLSASASNPEPKEISKQPSTKEDSSWICPNCKSENKGKFCSECGSPKPEIQ